MQSAGLIKERPLIRRFQDFSFRIADIGVRLKAGTEECRLALSGRWHSLFAFSAEGPSDLSLVVHKMTPQGLPPLSIKNILFNTNTMWSLYERTDGRYLFLDSASPSEPFNRMAILAPDLKEGALYHLHSAGNKDDVVDPIEYPLDQIMMISLLGRGRGMLIHSCGVRYKGHGLIFAGSSGAGKTTIANLLCRDKDFTILNDDRMAARERAGGYLIYGTPWHGTGRFAEPSSAPLEKIYFLKHGKENGIRPLGPAEAASRLFTVLFPPMWDREGVGFTLGMCAAISQSVQCCDLTFLPDQNVIHFIKEML